MSTKVLTSEEAADAESVHWPAAGSLAVGAPSVTDLALALQPATADPAQTAAVEVQMERLQADSEKRIQEAAAAGRREGEAAARESLAANVNSEIERLKQLSKQILGSAPALRKQAEADLVRLAIAIARRILHREIAVDSEALLGLTKAALSKIDQREIHKIRAHPDNVALLQRVLEQGRSQGRIEISGDARLDRGALIIDTARGQLDASVETHLEEIERGFTDLVGDQAG
jgi:flagellar assembly protein FliH